MKLTERRRLERLPASGSGTLEWTDPTRRHRTATVTVKDITADGVRLEADEPLETLNGARLVGETWECLGSIRYCRPENGRFVAGMQLTRLPIRRSHGWGPQLVKQKETSIEPARKLPPARPTAEKENRPGPRASEAATKAWDSCPSRPSEPISALQGEIRKGEAFVSTDSDVIPDRRRSERTPTGGWATLDCGPHCVTVRVTNLSDEGATIELAGPVEAPQMARLTGEVWQCLGWLRYCKPEGEKYVAGFQFTRSYPKNSCDYFD